MNLIKKLFVILLLFVCSCGSQNKGGSFSKDAVSFTFPSGWSIVE